MRALFATIAAGALATGVTACGGGGTTAGLSSHTPGKTKTLSEVSSAVVSHAEPPHGFLNDGDDDNPTGHGRPSSSYHDSDDSGIVAFVSGANPVETRAITGVVEGYYGALAAGEGAKACSMLLPSLAKSLPEDYGRGSGPPYLRGAGTCAAILARVSKHFHSSLAAAVTVTGVHINGGNAFVQLASRTLPLTEFKLRRQRGVWKVQVMIGDHDIGDVTFVASGSGANATNTQAVVGVVEAYYAALAAGNGTKACSMLVPDLAGSPAREESVSPGHPRGGGTCRAVVARLSKRFRSRLADAVTVTGVHIDAGNATVLLGSRSLPASDLKLQLVGGAWKVAEWIGPILP